MSVHNFKSKTTSSASSLNPEIKSEIEKHPKCQELFKEDYKIEAIHEYTDKAGKNIFYRVRLKNPFTQKKWIRPIHFNGSKWIWKEPDFENSLKPLYNLEVIASNPDATITVCEGEWAADHLNKLFLNNGVADKHIATTSGSAKSANKADWHPLGERKVIIWTDNDNTGFDYRESVTSLLVELGCEIRWIDTEALDLPEGGDAVNWIELNPSKSYQDLLKSYLINPEPEVVVKPLFTLEEAGVTDFMKSPPPPRKYVLENCLPLGKSALLVGPGGVRKSHFALQLQLAIATGRRLCGVWQIGEIGSTLGLYAEEDVEELHRRLYGICQQIPETFHSAIKQQVFIKSMASINNQMIFNNSFEIIRTDYVDRLIAVTKGIPNLKLIVIDPASRFRGGDENSSLDSTRFVEACEYISQHTGATVLIIHHVNKASMQEGGSSQAAARGSSALTDGVRWQMNMSVMSGKEAKEFNITNERRRFYVKAIVTKNNYAPPQECDVWLEIDGVNGVLKKAELHVAAEDKKMKTISAIVKKIEEDAEKGIEHSKTAFVKTYAGKEGIFGIGDKGLRGIINVTIEKGIIALRPPQSGKKNVTTVLAVPNPLDANVMSTKEMEELSSQL